MKILNQISILAFILIATTGYAQVSQEKIISFETRLITKPIIISTGLAFEFPLSSKLSMNISAGVLFGNQTQFAPAKGAALLKSDLTAFDCIPQLRWYFGKNGVLNGLFVSGSGRAILGTEKNWQTYDNGTGLISNTYKKSSYLIGPEVGAGYQMALSLIGLSIGMFANGAYLFTTADYPSPPYVYGFKGNFISGARLEFGFAMGFLIGGGKTLEKYKSPDS